MDFEPGEISTTYAVPYTIAVRHDTLKWAKEIYFDSDKIEYHGPPTIDRVNNCINLAARFANFILEGERGL